MTCSETSKSGHLLEGENLTPRAPSSKQETGMLGFAPGRVTHRLGTYGAPSSRGESGQTLLGHQPKARNRTPAGCAGCRLEWGDAASGLPAGPPRVLQHLPVLVTCCHLVPPHHKCWGPEVLKVGMPQVSRMGCKVPVGSPFSTPVAPSNPTCPPKDNLHLVLQTGQ